MIYQYIQAIIIEIKNFKKKGTYIPLPPLKIQTPPSRPSYILFLLRVGLLSVLIQTPAMALSKISFCSRMPNPPLYTKTPPFCPPHILLRQIIGLLPVLKRKKIELN